MKRLLPLIALMAAVPAKAGDLYVSPTGNDTGDGQHDTPFRTIGAAIEKATPGTVIYLREGVYRPNTADIMQPNGEGGNYDCVYYLDKDGSSEQPFTIAGYPGEKAVIDLSDIKTGRRIIGFDMKGDHWHLKNFDIVGIQVTQTGHTQSINVALFGGSNCRIEQVNMHDGMGIGVYATKGHDNLVLNCDAYNNYDPVSEDARGGNCDGFGFHLKDTGATGNVISGCRAWRNSDDGFDLINNYAPVTIENCWAWENGYDADMNSRGDGTGIKSGGFGMKPHAKAPDEIPRNIIRNCLAYANKNQGIYANHHLGGLDFDSNTAYRNRRNFNMVCRKSADEAIDVDGYRHRLTNNISFEPGDKNADCVNIDKNRSILTNNNFSAGINLTTSDFESLDASQLLMPRKADGSLPEITFLRLKPESEAAKAGMGRK